MNSMDFIMNFFFFIAVATGVPVIFTVLADIGEYAIDKLFPEPVVEHTTTNTDTDTDTNTVDTVEVEQRIHSINIGQWVQFPTTPANMRVFQAPVKPAVSSCEPAYETIATQPIQSIGSMVSGLDGACVNAEQYVPAPAATAADVDKECTVSALRAILEQKEAIIADLTNGLLEALSDKEEAITAHEQNFKLAIETAAKLKNENEVLKEKLALEEAAHNLSIDRLNAMEDLQKAQAYEKYEEHQAEEATTYSEQGYKVDVELDTLVSACEETFQAEAQAETQTEEVITLNPEQHQLMGITGKLNDIINTEERPFGYDNSVSMIRSLFAHKKNSLKYFDIASVMPAVRGSLDTYEGKYCAGTIDMVVQPILNALMYEHLIHEMATDSGPNSAMAAVSAIRGGMYYKKHNPKGISEKATDVLRPHAIAAAQRLVDKYVGKHC